MSLNAYKKKRTLATTPEPQGGKATEEKLRFVVQKHHASRLHYDFRIEWRGVLKSWAVPKGPSLNPKDKRLAVAVEDHPYDYKDFEGVIPKGNYGAGTVIVWDEGTYEPIGASGDKKAMEKELAKQWKAGSLKLSLKGKKLKGEFALVRMKSAEENAWLLLKHDDWNDTIVNEFAPELRDKEYPSAVSVYRKVLASQPDNSVTIVTVGFMSNISDLLDSPSDEYSDLNGIDLVKQKVKEWVAMAGGLPEGREFNVFQDAPASVNAFTKWPKPILFSGFEIGSKIFTGNEVAKQDTRSNPVARGYAYNFDTYTKDGETRRQSWDQTAVLVAVRNPEDYFYVNGPGKFIINEDGTNTWDPTTDADHYFLVHKYPYQHIADGIEELMRHEP